PADLYLEGPDQFRGYFNSSLTTAVATRGRAPYRQVVCHGFVVDGEGRKMSKSIGNTIAPDEIVQASGADVLRLWATSADYTADIRVSKEVLAGVSEGYRKIRNTWRFLLGNLDGFDPARDLVPLSELTGLEGYMRGRMGELVQTVRESYESYALQGVYQAVLNFAAVDLSSLY
ncbi:isoleucyl-tRNA synthetase, partial [mine drainage metagenome]